MNSKIWPFPPAGKRCYAIMEVLRRVPNQPNPYFDDLNQKAGSTFEWFVPEEYKFAAVVPFSKPSVLYLGYIIEKLFRSKKVVIAIVAHELAHIWLNRRTQEAHEAKRDIDHKDAHKDAEELTKEWGFKQEERSWKRTRFARETRRFEQADAEMRRLKKLP